MRCVSSGCRRKAVAFWVVTTSRQRETNTRATVCAVHAKRAETMGDRTVAFRREQAA